MLSRLFLPLVGILLIVGGCGTAPPVASSTTQGNYDHTRAYLAWMIEQEMDRNEITGISIALVDNQQVIWQQGFGYADLENKGSSGFSYGRKG